MKIAFIWSITGIFILICVAYATEPKLIDLKDMDNNVDRTVVIKGEVMQASYRGKVTSFTISDGKNEALAVMFNKPNKQVSKGDVVQLAGKIDLYQGTAQMNINEMRCLICKQKTSEQ